MNKIRRESIEIADKIIRLADGGIVTVLKIAIVIDEMLDKHVSSKMLSEFQQQLSEADVIIQGLSETVQAQSNKLKTIFDQHGFVKTGSWLGDLEMLDCKITRYQDQIQGLKDRSALSGKESVNQVIEQRDRARNERDELGQKLGKLREEKNRELKAVAKKHGLLQQNKREVDSVIKEIESTLKEVLTKHVFPVSDSVFENIDTLDVNIEELRNYSSSDELRALRQECLRVGEERDKAMIELGVKNVEHRRKAQLYNEMRCERDSARHATAVAKGEHDETLKLLHVKDAEIRKLREKL